MNKKKRIEVLERASSVSRIDHNDSIRLKVIPASSKPSAPATSIVSRSVSSYHSPVNRITKQKGSECVICANEGDCFRHE
jgi:hypothetical protein